MEEFEISLATAQRDIAYLKDRLLAPLNFNHRENGFYYSRDNYTLPFENNPSLLLILGLLSNLAQETGLAELPELAELKKYLQRMVFPGQKDIQKLLYCEWIEKEEIKKEVFQTVMDALRDKKQVDIIYRDGTGKESSRLLDPLKLVNYQGRWYLLGWCYSRRQRRIFHLARIMVIGTNNRKIADYSDDNNDWLHASFGIFKGPARAMAVIRFTGLAAELVKHQQWHPEQERREEGSIVILRLPMADDRELIMKVLQFGALAEVIEPQSLRIKLEQETEKMHRLYRK